ncbi:MAG TPA: MFS transporter, partial [Paracoccus sp. (in: a-proteobacteria)]|nr:MFS transporter [Paracoccus sp. (in: a-proteobacteria)]
AGPVARWIGSARRTAIWGHVLAVATLAGLWLWPAQGLGLAVVLLGLIGLTGTNYALVMAHGRAFLPAHLVGRGVTLLNMVSIGGVGIMQFASRPVFAAASEGRAPAQAFSLLFLFFLVPMAFGLALYLLTPEAQDG